MTAPTQPPVPRDTIETAFLVNQVVLYHAETGDVHELNPSASAVWMLLDGETSVEQIAVELHELLGVPLEQLRPDCQTIVRDFAGRDLLEQSHEAPPHANTDPIPAPATEGERTTELLHPPLEP